MNGIDITFSHFHALSKNYRLFQLTYQFLPTYPYALNFLKYGHRLVREDNIAEDCFVME